MKYVLFLYAGNCFITKDDLSSEYFLFEERFGSPMTSGTFEEMVNYSLEFQSRRQFIPTMDDVYKHALNL